MNQPGLEATKIEYRKIRVPREDGTTLEIPSLSQAGHVWRSNQSIIESQSDHHGFSGRTWSDLRQKARLEITRFAIQYSSVYLPGDVAEWVESRKAGIIMSGHQPELFHPGVWFKNFCLSTIAAKTNSIPINLVVDSDLASRNRIAIPRIDPTSDRVVYQTVEFDGAYQVVPHELRPIVDESVFESFPDRIARSLNEYNGSSNLLAVKLWSHIHEVRRVTDNLSLGSLIAAGRHRLEAELGLYSLELPLSQLSTTDSFLEFASHVIQNIATFRESYNRSLHEYRRVHRIRSTSHPVPELTQRYEPDGIYFETPFWTWHSSSQRRRPLFAKVDSRTIKLTDFDRVKTTLDQNCPTDGLRELPNQGIALRPKALMTTMFSRMLASDLFIHGIGGSKYDQLTDAIASRFFNMQLPEYLTLSASFLIPTDRSRIKAGDISVAKQLHRERRYHPERHVKSGDGPVREWIDQKKRLIETIRAEGSSLESHQQMELVNESLRSHLSESNADVAKRIADMKSKLRESELIGSRDYSFCLFDHQLVDRLKKKAKCLE